MNITTRRFHRSSMQAFPKTVEYGCAIERFEQPKTPASEWALYIACVVAVIVIWSTR